MDGLGGERTAMRFGLAGTGYWAQAAHARALAATTGAKLTAVWGRDQAKAAALAGPYGAAAHTDFDAFLADVDAVAFSVPPDVQSELGVRAAVAGKHLLLEKPVALTAAAAGRLADAVTAAGVASLVFFTARFQADIRDWLTAAAGTPWSGAQVVWLGSATDGSSPFNTPWRRVHGGLWDLGPHALSVLTATLGPVVSVLADGGPGDVAHLILRHESGATSTVTVTVQAPPELDTFRLVLWGEHGRSPLPALADDPAVALGTAVAELISAARSADRAHPCDVHFGAAVTRVLADAQQQIDTRRPAG
jgi:predicted dehydrogenase